MKVLCILIIAFVLISTSIIFGNTPLQKVDGMLPTYGAESGNFGDFPPPIDSICLVFAGVDYGGSHSSPQNYVNAKHITNVAVGSYYFPVVIWETGPSWHGQSLFSYWDDLFKFWSYADSFTTNNGQDTGRPAVCADSKGNLHFCWHQLGSPDGYETFYTRAILDTSAGVVMYNIERPAQFISSTNGEEETFPAMAIYGDTLIMVVYSAGPIGGEHAINYNYSTDGGTTWAGNATAYDHGAIMPGSWQLASIAPDPTSGDMWVGYDFDMSGDGSMDIVAFHWDAATNIWTNETVANATSMHAYCLPATVVDYNGIPHIIFQENHGTGGGIGGLTVYPACGPFGTLYYTHRQGGSWSSPMKIMLPRPPAGDFQCGHPSAGIAMDNTIYYSTTQPESTTSDTGAYLPFNVHYAEISPYTGVISYGGKVSDIPWADTTNAIYAHITYDVPADGPGVTWCQMVNAAVPADVYYCHKDTIAVAVEEKGDVSSHMPSMLYQNYPNPAYGKTMIRFTVPNNTDISLDIYDISGRLVKTLARGVPRTGSSFVVWNGKDSNGKEVPGGVYLYTLKAGSYTETRKLLLVH